MKKIKKVLVVVAHPDDETIWMGGTLIRHKEDWSTTIISLCRENDPDRATKFKRVCSILNAKCYISDLDDVNLNPLREDELTKRILKYLEGDYDYVFTHGENGEYEHVRHKEIHGAIKRLVIGGKINTGKLFFFSYRKMENDFQGYAVYNPNANIFINLNETGLLLKKKLIKNIYGFQEGGFEEISSAKIEAFEKFKK